MTPVVSVRNFTKKFGSKVAVDDLSFDVEKGEVFAFLGTNGSGKTTTIRCLLGMHTPTAGELTILGKHYDQSMSPHIGYLPEERGLYTNAKVLETLVYFAQLKGFSAKDANTRSLNYLEEVELLDKKDSEVKRLSSGQQQKVQLGLAIINEPEILILDEPTKGLDPVNSAVLMAKLGELNKRGSTVIFITHQMDEVERIADRLLMIKNGKRILYGKVQEVRREFGSNVVHVRFEGSLPTNNKLFRANIENHAAELTPAEGVTADEVLAYLVGEQVHLNRYEVAAPSLAEIFIKVSKEDR